MELLSGLLKSIRHEQIDFLSSKTVRNVISNGTLKAEKILDRQVIGENLETLLKRWLDEGDEQCAFYLGQIYFEKEKYNEAWNYFRMGYEKFNDQKSKFQLGIMLYDNLVSKDVTKVSNPQAKACEFFKEIMTLDVQIASPVDQRNLVFSAAFNLGRAYYQGYGVCSSTEDALRCFLFAANNGDSKACISAQTALGYLYSGPEICDLQKAFQWHSDACGNGSVESQGFITKHRISF